MWLTTDGALSALVGLSLPNWTLSRWLLPAGMVVSLLVIWLVFASYLDGRRDPDPLPVSL